MPRCRLLECLDTTFETLLDDRFRCTTAVQSRLMGHSAFYEAERDGNRTLGHYRDAPNDSTAAAIVAYERPLLSSAETADTVGVGGTSA